MVKIAPHCRKDVSGILREKEGGERGERRVGGGKEGVGG